MNQQPNSEPRPPHESWLPAEFLENSHKFPSEELMKYAGKHIAWSLDGTRIVASADDSKALLEAIKSLGLSPSRVVRSYVEPADEFCA
jgi:hypothetical protein